MTEHDPRPAAEAKPTNPHAPPRSDPAVVSVLRADRAVSEAAIAELYRAAGLAPPRHIYWCEGPIELSRRRERAASGADAGPTLYPLIQRLIGASRGRHDDPWRDRPLLSLTQPPPDRYRALRRTVLALLDEDDAANAIGVKLRNALGYIRGYRRPLPWNSLETSSWSQFDAATLGSTVDGDGGGGTASAMSLIAPLHRLVSNCGWAAAHRGICWLGERPTTLRLDDQLRLHAAEGPAIAYADGWRVHAWKGVRVPARMIEQKDTITVSAIHRATDPVIRRCMIDMMTPERFVANGGALIISKDDAGILWHRRWRTDAWSAVEVINGSREPDGSFKRYFLQVPADMRTARQAVAWTYHMTERQYARLDIRT